MPDSDSDSEENAMPPQPSEGRKLQYVMNQGHTLQNVLGNSFVPVLSLAERAKIQKDMHELQIAVTLRSLTLYIEEGRPAQVERILRNNDGPGSLMNSLLPCGEYPLTLALYCKQWGIVDVLLQQQHINVNVVGKCGESALLMAVREAEASKFIRLMVAKGAKMDATDAHGNGIMDICIRSLNYVTMQLLISLGLKTNFSSHWAPLWMFAAVAHDDDSCLKFLLQQFALPSISRSSAVPVLSDAIARKSIRCARVLIGAGADVNSTVPIPSSSDDPCGVWQFGCVSSLQLASSQNDEDLVLQLLLAGAHPSESFAIPVNSALCTTDLRSPIFGKDVREWQLVTPLIWAIKYRKVATVKFLLKSSSVIDVNAVPLLTAGHTFPAMSSSWTPLMWAIANLAEDVATETGLSTNVSSNRSYSAAREIVEVLMDFPGMNPNAGSLSDEATPLSLAAALCLEDMIQLLVGKGSSIVESRALEEATAFAHPTCLRLLCRLVAEQHYQLTTDIASRLMASLVECLNVAAASGLLECTHIINTFFSEFLKPVVCTETVNRGHLDWEKALASALLDSCANCQPHLTAYLQPLACFSSSVLGMALQYASKNGDATSCEKLLLAGAKGDWVDPHKQKLRTKPGSRTAVSAAFKRWGRTGLHEYEACCSLLINTCNSSAVNVRDSHGSTPLKWAAIRGHLDLLIALLDKGADVFAEDSDGNTPIAHAVMHSHGLIVCELIDREPQLYKARINVPSCLKVYESGLLPPTLPMSSRELHLNVHEAVFKSKIPTSVPNVLFVRTFKELKFVESLKSVLACAHNHSACIQVDTKSQYSSQILDHLNILMIRDIAYSCPSLPLPQHICYRDIISAAACIGMRAPMMRLVRAACTAGAGVASFHSREGDSLLLLCSGHNWRDEVNAIIASGCPVDIPSRDDPLFTAIVWAAHKGHSEIVLDLLLAGSKHAQTAMIIAAARCHVSVLEVICQAVASKPASQRPDTSCALLIAAAHGSGAAITALASISPVPQIISDLRCSCVKGIAELLTPPQVTVDDVVGSPSVVLIDRDSKYTQVFRWLLPGAYKALVHHQFEQRAVSKELEWESSDAVVMGFNFKNKLMYAHQNLTAVFGSEDWAERMKLSRSVLLSSVLSNSQPSIELSLTSEQQGYFCCIDASSSEFPHNDCFFVSESVRPLFCFADDVLMSIQTRRLSRQSSFWQGFTCSLQLEHKDDLGHSIISSNGLDLSDVTWMLLIPDTTPLHMVAASGSVEALKTLLSLMHNHQPPHSSPSAAFSATDSSGLTPLCYAARFADTRMCALLLDQGADIKPWEHVIQRTILWINNRRRWRSLLSALVSIHAVTGDLPLIPQHNEATLPSPFSSDECDGLVCVPCVLWAALSGSEAKTRLFVEAGADAVNALAWIQSVGFRYCQENSAMHNVAVKTMTNSQDYVLLGPYAPTARAGDEAEGIQPIPAPDSFSIGDYKRHEVPPGHRVQVVAAILGWNDWTLRKLTTFHDIPQDHYAVTAAKSGKSQQVPGKPDLMQAVQLRVDEFILQAVVVIGVNYVLGVRFTTNQRTLPWMGRNWGDDECKIQRVVQCTPQGREICGFFGLKASGGHGRLLHLGFVARLRGGSDCMRRHRQGVISMTEEWLEPVKLFSMEDALKASIIENTQKKTGLIPRSKTPWNRSPLPGHTLSRSSSAAFLLREFENSERSGIETAVMNHVWTESSTQHGGSKSVFIPSVSPLSSLAVPPATASSPSRRRTSVPKKNQHHPRIVVDQYVSSLPSVLSGGRRAQKLTSPTQVSTKSDHPKHKTTLSPSYEFPLHVGMPLSHRPHHKLFSPISSESLAKQFSNSGMTEAQIQLAADRARNSPLILPVIPAQLARLRQVWM